VQTFVDDRSRLAALRGLLAGVRDLERLVQKVDSARANPRDLKALAHSLRPIPEILRHLESSAYIPERTLGEETGIVDLIDRSIQDEAPVLMTDGGFIAPGYSAELDELRTICGRPGSARRAAEALWEELA
jgi:DNA mismatch repair protein MutS